MPYYILALAFSIASQTLELLPMVPQKKCVPHGILVSFFTEYRYSYLRLESNPKQDMALSNFYLEHSKESPSKQNLEVEIPIKTYIPYLLI